MHDHNKKSTLHLHSFAWLTGAFFLVSLIGHWIFGWFAYVDEQTAHSQPLEVSSYVIEVGRDTLENWQSEFLQLLWQVGGLAFLLYVGSPQSKEGDDRKEEKLDAIIRQLDPENGQKLIDQIDKRFYKGPVEE